MQTATLTTPRAATLADLRVGDACFVIADMFKPRAPLVYLGRVTERSKHGGLTVEPERTNDVHDQGRAQRYFADGRAVLTRGMSVAVEVPAGARVLGSLAGHQSGTVCNHFPGLWGRQEGSGGDRRGQPTSAGPCWTESRGVDRPGRPTFTSKG